MTMNGPQNNFLKPMNPVILPGLLVALLLAQPVTLAATEVSGLSFEQQGKSTALTVDVDKASGAKVEKKKNGTVVIHLPKSNLPKAYQQYGLPPIQDNSSGLSATVQKSGDGLEIIVPAAASKNLKVQLKSSSGSVTQVGGTTATVSKPIAPKTTAVKTATTPATKTTKPTTVTSKPIAKPVAIKTVSKTAPIKVLPVKKPTTAVKPTVKPTTTSATTNKTVKPATTPKLVVGPVVPLTKTTTTNNSGPATQPKDLNPEKSTKLMGPEETNASTSPLATTATTKLPSLLTTTTKTLTNNTAPEQNSIQKLVSSPYVQWFFLLCGVLGGGLIVVIFAISMLLRARKKQALVPQETTPIEEAFYPEPPPEQVSAQQGGARSFEDHLVNAAEHPVEQTLIQPLQQEQPMASRPITKQNASQPAVQTSPATTDMRFAQLAQSRKKRF